MKLMLALVALCALWLAPPRVGGDMAPPGVKSVDYKLVISNLAEYPGYVLIVYPTSNNGYGYVFEEGKGLTNVMMSDRKGSPSRLFAMTRADFAKHAPNPNRYPHG